MIRKWKNTQKRRRLRVLFDGCWRLTSVGFIINNNTAFAGIILLPSDFLIHVIVFFFFVNYCLVADEEKVLAHGSQGSISAAE